jgi:hypothetical protein
MVSLVRGSTDEERRLIVLPAFETLPFKSKGNAAEDELTHKVAAFAQNADKAGLKVCDTGHLWRHWSRLQLLVAADTVQHQASAITEVPNALQSTTGGFNRACHNPSPSNVCHSEPCEP